MRRWPWIVLALLLLGVIVAWMALTSFIAMAANRKLPRDLGHGLRAERASAGIDGPAELALRTAPGVVVTLARDAAQRELPAWALRDGLAISGTWAVSDATLRWRALIDSSATPPHLDAHLPADWVNAQLAKAPARTHFFGKDLRWRYHFAPGSRLVASNPGTATPSGWERRAILTGSGDVTAILDGREAYAEISRIEGTVLIQATRTTAGWTFAASCEISVCEHTLVRCDDETLRLMAVNLGGVIALLVNEQLSADALSGLVVPAWCPLDPLLDVRLR